MPTTTIFQKKRNRTLSKAISMEIWYHMYKEKPIQQTPQKSLQLPMNIWNREFATSGRVKIVKKVHFLSEK